MNLSKFLESYSSDLATSSGTAPESEARAAPDAPSQGEGLTSLQSRTSSSLAERLAGGASKSASNALVAAENRLPAKEATETSLAHALDSSAAHITVDLDNRLPGGPLTQLEGTTITHYATEPSDDLPKLIAVNTIFITYGLQKGHVRVLHKQTGLRALLKERDALLTDLRLFGEGSNDLASADVTGHVIVWRLECDGQQVLARTLISLALLNGTDTVVGVRLDCRLSPQELVAAAADRILHVSVPAVVDCEAEQALVDVNSPPPGIASVPLDSSAHVTALTFSPDALSLAVGSADGKVRVLRIPSKEGAVLVAEASAGDKVDSVMWLSHDVLLVGSIRNTELQIWKLHSELGFQHQQTTVLHSTQAELVNSLAFDATYGIVLLSTIRGNSVAALHLTDSRDSFDAFAQFQVTMPIFSMEAHSSSSNGAMPGGIQVYTVQSQAIQQYTLQPELCLPPEALAAGAPALAPAQAPPQLDEPAVSDAKDAVFDNFARSAAMTSPLYSTAPAEAASLPAPASLVSATVTPPQPFSQPALLLTPSQVISASRAALPRSLSGNSSVVEGDGATRQPPGPSRRGFAAAEASHPAPTLLQRMAAGTEAPESSPDGKIGGAEFFPSSTRSASDATSRSADFRAAEAPRPPSQIGVVPGFLVARESESAASRNVASKPETAPRDAQHERLEAVRTALQGLEGEGEVVTGDSGAPASLGDLYEQLQRDQKKLLVQLQQSQQATVRALKEDVRRETKRLETATEAQIARYVKSQLRTIGEERKALIAEERQNMEKLLVAISGSINRDLPQRIEEMLKSEVVAVTRQAGLAVAQALGEALPRELASGNLQAAVEKALANQLRSALTKPVMEGFRASFQQQVIPAFESACQNMFAQVQATFAGGLAEHLQAAGGANATITASLRDSLGQAKAVAAKLADDVSKGYQQLLELATQELQERRATGKELALTVDHKAELTTLMEARRYDDAFSKALDLGDVGIVAWLCSQVEPQALLETSPPLLSQHVMLVLVQQLGYDLSEDTSLKVRWIKDLAEELDPQDPVLAPHMQGVLQAALTNIQRHNFGGRDIKSARFATAVLESALQGCKP